MTDEQKERAREYARNRQRFKRGWERFRLARARPEDASEYCDTCGALWGTPHLDECPAKDLWLRSINHNLWRLTGGHGLLIRVSRAWPGIVLPPYEPAPIALLSEIREMPAVRVYVPVPGTSVALGSDTDSRDLSYAIGHGDVIAVEP